MQDDLSLRLAAHCASVRFEDLGTQDVAAAKLRVLDVIGCLTAGRYAARNDALAGVLLRQGGSPESTVYGRRQKLPAAQAAMLNAIMARSYDFEVMGVVAENMFFPSHHAATMVTTALALAERTGATGRDLLTAMIVGDDLAARLLAASGLDFGQGWDGSGTYTALGAAAVAARLLQLDAQGTCDAFGLAVSQIAGTIQSLWDGATDFKLSQGRAGRDAILAAELAAANWVGMKEPLLARFGFFHQYTAGCIRPDILTAGLGKTFYAERYFKPYSFCMATHVVIEAALPVRAQWQAVESEAIDAIALRLPPKSMQNFCAKPYAPGRDPHPSAIFSYPYAVATTLLRGAPTPAHFTEAALRDPAIMALTGKVVLCADAAREQGAALEVRLHSGRTISAAVLLPSRSPLLRPASSGEVHEKFRTQAVEHGALSPQRAAAILDCVEALDSADGTGHLRDLFALLQDA